MASTRDPSSRSAVPTLPREFVFATCFDGSNAWLRRDVARYHPELRLAFSVPGLVTWKAPTLPADFNLRSPLGVTSGFGVGRVATLADLRRVVGETMPGLAHGQPVVLHVCSLPRSAEQTAEHAKLPGGEPDGGDIGDRLRATEQCLREVSSFAEGTNARVGARVLDVVHLGGESDAYFVGWHVQGADRPTAVGGVMARPPVPEAPSRAYSKTLELLALGELSVSPGQRVVELGAAPGGGTVAWLEQRAAVTAIDPADMAPVVAELATRMGAPYRHLRVSAGEVAASELPRNPDYLYSDMNLAPAVVLRYLERLCALVGAPKRALLVNFKVNDQKVEDQLPGLLQRVGALADRLGCDLRSAQLPSHRKEIGVVLRRRSQAAKAKGKRPKK